jgi:hypothetical protein
MTRNHLVQFAAEIRTVSDITTRFHRAWMVIRVAQQDNCQLDRAAFVTACGL